MIHFKNKKRYPFFGVAFIALFFLLSAVVMLLWNMVLPSVISVGSIGYFQAMGLLALCRILTGGKNIYPHKYRCAGNCSNKYRVTE